MVLFIRKLLRKLNYLNFFLAGAFIQLIYQLAYILFSCCLSKMKKSNSPQPEELAKNIYIALLHSADPAWAVSGTRNVWRGVSRYWVLLGLVGGGGHIV